MGFGLNQLQKTTPQIVKNIRYTLLYFFMGCLAFANLFASKLHMTGEDYAMWIGFVMLAIKSMSKFFGINEDEAVKNVMDAVQEVKEETKKP